MIQQIQLLIRLIRIVMNILFTTSNEYACHAGVAITSLFENNKGIDINVFIMTTGYSDDNLLRMANLADRYHQKIKVITVEEKSLQFEIPTGKWGIYTYLKLFAYRYIHVDRLLYLDTDIIVCPNDICHLSDINEIDISNYYIAIPPDTNRYNFYRNKLPFYGCCGVIYMNLEKWRSENLTQKAFDFLNQEACHIKYAEQDILNNICKNHIYELPLRYNMMNLYLKNDSYLPNKYKTIFEVELRKTVILHYAAVIKPWNSDCNFYLKNLYWRYAKLSGWNIKSSRSSEYTILRYGGKLFFTLLQSLGLYKHKNLFLSRRNVHSINPNF